MNTTPPLPRRLLLGLTLASLAARLGTAGLFDNPGYIDADYHFSVAQNIARGRGLVEDFVWNYLDTSPLAMRLPHPSHLYWMPLTTGIAWLGIRLFGWALSPYHAAEVPFAVLSALLPPFSAWVAWRLWERRDFALQAGLLTLFASAYFHRWVTPDTFTPYAAAVAVCFFGAFEGSRGAARGWAIAGAGAGLAHLARIDGVLVLPILAYAALRSQARAGGAIRALALLGGAYLAVMAPWFARNLSLFGAPLPTTGTKTLWLRRYDEIFSYGLPLTPGRFFAQGAAAVLRSKAESTWTNATDLLRTFQFVLPIVVGLGYARARRVKDAQLLLVPAVYAVALFTSMCLIFSYPAQYGSLFRSLAALVAFGMAVAPAGIEAAADRYAALRGRDLAPTRRFFARGVVGLTAAVAGLVLVNELSSVLPGRPTEPWNRRLDHYTAIDRWLRARGETGPVLVVAPPTFALATGRSAIVVPSDGPAAIRAAADRFEARWLIVESNIESLRDVWRDAAPLDGFHHVKSFSDGMGSPVRLLEREDVAFATR